MKKWREDINTIDDAIKTDENIVRNIQSLITFYNTNLCIHDTMKQFVNTETYTLCYKCTKCDHIGYINI